MTESLDYIAKAEFLDIEKLSGCDALPCFGCDAGPLPPGCDCICHTPCDFGKTSTYEASNNEVYEL